MKTMKLGDQIKRVSEKDVDRMHKEGWNYCPKSEWKEKVRAFQKPKEEPTEKKKGKGKPKGKAKKNK